MTKAAGDKRSSRKLDVDRLRNLLLKERTRVLGELGYIEDNYLGKTPREATGSGSAYSMHPADQGTDSNEQEKAYMIGAATGATLEDIDEALRKIDHQAFGLCERCGKEISSERLEAVPYARLCVECKAGAEKSA
jgi:DnaK suppressor protein